MIEYDENGNMRVPIEAILERLSAKVSQLTMEVATLQTANQLLQEELKDYTSDKKTDLKGI